jgi:hypothetical protein
MPVDTAPEAVKAAMPVLSSGEEAVAVAREFAASIADGVIGRDRSAAVPARELSALDASGLLGLRCRARTAAPTCRPRCSRR